MFCGVWEKSTTQLFKVKNLSKECNLFKQKKLFIIINIFFCFSYSTQKVLKNSNYICRILLYANLDKIDIISYYSILFTLNSSFFLIKGWTWILKIWSFKMTPWLLMVAVKLSLAKFISFCMYTTSSLSILTLKKKKKY